MIESAVYAWKLQGRLHVWCYLPPVRGLNGWHLNADAATCTSLIDLVDRMLGAEGKSHKRIPVIIPVQMRIGQGHPWTPVSELILRYPQGEVEDDFWQIELGEGNVLTLTVGRGKLQELRESLQGLPHGKDDFALGPTVPWESVRRSKAARTRFAAECLWFWTKIE